jgi:hypothetical protein
MGDVLLFASQHTARMHAFPGRHAASERQCNNGVAISVGSARTAGRGGARLHRACAAPALIVPALAAVLGLAACGSGPSGASVASQGSTTSVPGASSGSPAPAGASATGPPAEQALAFARCLRHHGVPGFPDPDSNGNFPPSAKQATARNPRQFREARNACSDLLPGGGNGPTAAEWQQILTTMVKFAQCMRHNGVPRWPDPSYDTHGRPVFNITVDPSSPQFVAEISACRHLLVDYGNRPGWPDMSNYFQQSGP